MAFPAAWPFPTVWRENYAALRKRGMGRIKSFLLATNPEFHHKLLRVPEPAKLAEEFAAETEEALKKFEGRPGHFFSAMPTRREFANYLILEKKLSPSEAYYQALVRQTASKRYKKDPRAASSFALRNWALWKAEKASKVLFAREFSRERPASKERRRIFEEDVAKAVVEGVKAIGDPGGIRLKVMWGGHKETEEGVADARDEQVLKRVKYFADAIERETGLKVGVGLLFSDIHSEKINRVEPEKIRRYYESISQLAKKEGFTVSRLSEVWKERNPFKVPGWEESEEAKQVLGRAAGIVETLDKLGLIAKGAERAEKHAAEVIAGVAKAEKVSEVYHVFQAVEKHMLEKMRSPGTLYISFEDPERVLEHKPKHTLFFWSFKRGLGETPWFGRKAL